jgi:phosphoglycerate dehydrogenase-like enzyme
MNIWCNAVLTNEAKQVLKDGLKEHTLVIDEGSINSLTSSPYTIAFGQPDAEACLTNQSLKWAALTTAGYTRYDTASFKETMKSRSTVFTNASTVYADPCAQHVLAMMLCLSRQLTASIESQRTNHNWPYIERRQKATLLTAQTVVLLGYGAIGRRLVELLKPFNMQIIAIRRQVRSELGVRIVPEEDMTRVLALADHVVNILPLNESTFNYVNRRRLDCMKRGARFYNIGRGTNVDQNALIEALNSGRLESAYLDVMDPEPLPENHPLWTTQNCYLTPHIAGGYKHLDLAVVRHFLSNLEAFTHGMPLTDQVI